MWKDTKNHKYFQRRVGEDVRTEEYFARERGGGGGGDTWKQEYFKREMGKTPGIRNTLRERGGGMTPGMRNTLRGRWGRRQESGIR